MQHAPKGNRAAGWGLADGHIRPRLQQVSKLCQKQGPSVSVKTPTPAPTKRVTTADLSGMHETAHWLPGTCLNTAAHVWSQAEGLLRAPAGKARQWQQLVTLASCCCIMHQHTHRHNGGSHWAVVGWVGVAGGRDGGAGVECARLRRRDRHHIRHAAAHRNAGRIAGQGGPGDGHTAACLP